MRLLPVGPDAVLVEVGSTDEAMALYEAARASAMAARDIVPAARTVLFDGVRREDVEALVAGGVASRAPSSSARTVELPTSYDGPDLEATAAVLGLTPDEL